MTASPTTRKERVRAPSGPPASTPSEHDHRHEQELWDALNKARTEQAVQPLARVEDAVFRYYLPLARALAHGPDTDDPASPAVDAAAELGLAEAVLDWRHRGSDGFDRFARSSISHRLRRLNRHGTPKASETRFAHLG